MKKAVLILAAVFLPAGCMVWNVRDEGKPAGTVLFFSDAARHSLFDVKALPESSGLSEVDGEPGLFLTHGDSFSPSKIYLFRYNDGQIGDYRSIPVKGAVQSDWEDLARGKDGQIYLADIGDNLRLRTEKRIYRIDGKKTVSSGTALVEEKWVIRCRMDGKTVYADTEALFIYKEKFYLITKNRGEALIFEADPKSGRRIDAHAVGSFSAFSEITSADIDAEEQRLAVLSYNYLYLVDVSDGLTGLSDKILKIFSLDCGQCEGVCFTSDGGLAVSNEDGDFYKLPASALGSLTAGR
ncbi:MAG: hypothetical protein SOZ27_03655 [Spirochaetia bacterium]|nr:hypothetical protein [Spirochaetia bacterium]